MDRRSLTTDSGGKANKRFPFLLALVVGVRVLFALLVWSVKGPSGFFDPDSLSYLQLAESSLHGSFSLAGVPHLFRTPAYPAVLIPAIASGHFLIVAFIQNLIFSAISAWLIWNVAEELFPHSNARFWAVLLYCFEPMGLIYAGKLMSETLFTTLLLLFLCVFFRYLRAPTYRNLALTALALGAATYVRPVTLYLPLWLAPLLFFSPGSLPRMRRLLGVLLFFIVFVLTLAPWVIRNAVVADYIGFSSTGDEDLYFLCAAAVRGKLEHKDLVQEQDEMGYTQQRYFALHPEQRGWSRGKIIRFQRDEALKVLAQNPRVYLILHARGIVVVMFDPGAVDLLKLLRMYPDSGGLVSRILDQGLARATLWVVREHPISAILLPVLAAFLLACYALAFVGLHRLPFQTSVVIAAIFFYFVIVSAFPGAVARYRVPIMALVCIAAGAGIAQWKRRKQHSVSVSAH